jgi:hypothetical protein
MVGSLALQAQSTKVENSLTTLPPSVQERTYEENGKTVKERVTTSQMLERQVVSRIPGTYKAAIFVANRLTGENAGLTQPFEDMVTGKVTDRGFQVISKEVAADSMRQFDPELAQTPRPADSLDTKLSEQSSALRLAQGLNADYLLIVSLTSLGEKQRAINAYGVKKVMTESILRFTYKVIDGGTGQTVTADSDKVSVEAAQTENAVEKNDDAKNELLDAASVKIADSLRRRIDQQRIPAASATAQLATITINVETGDMAIPDIRVDGNVVSVGQGKMKVAPLNATVEVDGVAVGTAPGKISLRSGFSKLRVTREGYKPYEQTINAVNGQVLTVVMLMTEAGYARFQNATSFMNDLQNGARLTDGQVEVLRGQAKMLSQSGFKVETKDAPPTNIFR